MNKKIIVISNKDVCNVTGGAITVFNNFCNVLSLKNYDIYPAIYAKSLYLLNNIPKNTVNLYEKYNHNNYSKCLNSYINDIKPDLLVFFFPSLFYNAKINSEYNNIPKLLMFHSRPDIYFAFENFNLKKFNNMYSNTASQILFDSYYNLLPNFISKNTVISIPNCINVPKNHINPKIKKHKIIFLSRIDGYKGLELLINSFALISNKYKDWTIDIYGQSQPDYYIKYINKLIEAKHLRNRINIKGITLNPYKTYLDYDFCVFPSYFEGFPMGLLEALSCGLPSIGLKKCTGVNEIIIDGLNGYLVDDDAKSFADKIELLINNNNLRELLSKNSIKLSKKYSSDIVFDKWEHTINNLINGKVKNNKLVINNMNIFNISKILKLNGFVKKIYFKYKISKFPSKQILYISYLFLKITIPDGSKRQKFLKKFIKHLN